MSQVITPDIVLNRKRKKTVVEREPLNLRWADIRMPLLYMLCLSAVGLHFYPALLAVIIILLNRWKKDRYDFVMMLFLVCGEFGFVSKSVTGLYFYDILLAGSVLLWFLYRKPPLVNRLLTILLVYTAVIFILALFSIESMSIQFLTIRHYLAVFTVIIPIFVYGCPEFDARIFFRKTIVYALIICAFYVLDGIILCGNVLLPTTALWADADSSTFYDLLWRPFSFNIFRKYPPGLYFLMLAVYPMAKMYRINLWQWLIVFGALVCSLTFTVISGVLGAYVLLRVRLRNIILAVLGVIVGMVALYYVDASLPPKKGETYTESYLRIKSTVDQFAELYKAVDDEDLAKFASGRMSQIMPKFELMQREGKMWTGLGFLHREKSKINRYTLVNDYYTDISSNIEVATGVEVIPAQIIINIGYIGFLIHCLVFFLMWFIIRKLRYSGFVACVIFMNIWFGLGGFAGLISFIGLGILAIAYGGVLAANFDEVWGKDARRKRRRNRNGWPALEHVADK